MCRKGWPILSDDRILLFKKDGHYGAASITDIVKLREAAIDSFFPELRHGQPLFSMDGEYYYKAGEGKHLSYTPSTGIDCIVIMERTGERGSRIEKVNPMKVAGEMFPVTLNPYDPDGMKLKFAFLMDLLGRVDCCRVYFGTDMDEFAHLIEGIVK
jgi:hypothetical protein